MMARHKRLGLLLVLGLALLLAAEGGRRALGAQSLESGLELHAAGELGAARLALERAATLRPGSARAHLALAEVLRDQGDAKGAGEVLGALRVARLEAGERHRVLLAGAAVDSAGARPQGALEVCRRLLGEPSSRQVASEVHVLAARVLHRQLGRPAAAEEHLEEASDLAESLRDPRLEARVHLERALFERAYRRGRGGRLARHLEPALAAFEAAGDRIGQAETLAMMGLEALAAGDYAVHAERQHQAKRLFEAAGHLAGPARLESYLGAGEVGRERWREAHRYYTSSRRRLDELGQTVAVRSVDLLLADLRLRTGQLDAARITLDDVLEGLGDTAEKRKALLLLGHVDLHAGDAPAAAASYREALELDQRLEVEDPAFRLRAFAMLGHATLQAGEVEKAELLVDAARALAAESGDLAGEVVAHLAAADLAATRLQAEPRAQPRRALARRALQALEAATALQECHLTEPTESQRSKQKVTARGSPRARSASQGRDPEETDRQAESLEAPGSEHRAQGSCPGVQGEAQGEASPFFFEQYWQSIERLRHLLLDQELAAELRQRAKRDLFHLLELMRHRAPRSLPRSRPTLEAFQAALPRDAAVVFYAFGFERVFALVVRSDAARAVALPVDRRTLEDRVQLLLSRLEEAIEAASPGANPAAGADDPWRKLSKTLHRDLVEPLAGAGVEPGVDLGVVPLGVLHALPFAVLLDAQGRSLVERHVLWTAPSAAAMMPSPGRDSPPTFDAVAVDALGVGRGVEGPGLPATLDEARAVAALTGGRALLGRGATEEAATGSKADILHLAAHGVADAASPLDSRLALAVAEEPRGPETDGRLTAREIRELDLPQDLVVLSACRAGAGFAPRPDDWTGRDRVGLADAFLAAGVRRVVSSLLPVDDRGARDLMLDFYRELRRHPPAEALARAQRARLRSGDVGALGFGLSGEMPAAVDDQAH